MDALELFTAMFLVLSGLIVGYWLFYRDRSQEESVRGKLKKENGELRRSVQTSQVAFDSLQEKFGRQRGQLNVLQQLCDDWSSSRETSERERAQLEADLSSKSTRASELEKEFREEKQKRVELEDRLHKLAQEQLADKASVEKEWRCKHAEAETALNKQLVNFESVKGDRAQISKQLHTANARIAELESEIKSSQSMFETATANASGLKQEYVSLETGLKSTNDQLKRAEAEIAKAKSQRDVAIQESSDAAKDLAVLQKEAETLREQVRTYEQKLETSQSALTSTQQQLARVTEQRDQSMELEKATGVVASGLEKRLDNQESTIHMLRQSQDDALENLKHELKIRTELESKFDARIQAVRDDAEKAREEYETQLASLREEKDSIKTDHESKHETQLKELREQLSRQASQYAAHSRDLRDQLALQRKELDSERNRVTSESQAMASRLMSTESQFTDRIKQLETESSTYTESIVKLDAKREQLEKELETARSQMQMQLKQDSETIGELQRERNDLRTELDQLHESIAPLQEQLDAHHAFATELDLSQARIVDLERALGQRDQEAKRLHAQANELERLRQRYQDAKDRQEKVQCQLDEMVSRQIARESERSKDIARIHELEAQLAVSLETIDDLRKERAMVLATLAEKHQAREPDATIISFTQAMEETKPVVEEDYDPEYGGRTRRDANRGIVFTEAPETCDDLKRISGIAEVLEKRLNDFGIYTFRQVMEWKPLEIEEFSRLLAFRDRIDRDDWQGQARFFYNQKRKTVRSVA
jgi:predicted flap endonuclease-1-like 5' DNA nuclease/predicted  nucleic acid-binding Zn-ribbon protein